MSHHVNLHAAPGRAVTALVVTALATTGFSPRAHADSLLEPRSVTVHFEDLDTNNAHGAAVLYRRIKVAAQDVCSDLATVRSLTLSARYASCVEGAISDAVAKVNRPLLTGYAMARRAAPAGAPIKMKVARNN
jgi:UrcA family protein